MRMLDSEHGGREGTFLCMTTMSRTRQNGVQNGVAKIRWRKKRRLSERGTNLEAMCHPAGFPVRVARSFRKLFS